MSNRPPLRYPPSGDFYPSPPWTVRLLYETCAGLPVPTLEPAAGIGSITAALVGMGFPAPLSIELDPNLAAKAPYVRQGDGLALSWARHHVCTNPPYNEALRWVEKGLAEAASVTMLLRIAFLASKKRLALFRAHPPHTICILSKRPSFRWGATDKYDYAWLHWRRNPAVTVYSDRQNPYRLEQPPSPWRWPDADGNHRVRMEWLYPSAA